MQLFHLQDEVVACINLGRQIAELKDSLCYSFFLTFFFSFSVHAL